MQKFKCTFCGYVYDESAGVPGKGVAPGTRWEGLPPDFACPLCGAPKPVFKPVPEAAPEGLGGAPPDSAAPALGDSAALPFDKLQNQKGDKKMANLKGTKTEKNLMEAFAGESQARNKYTYFAGRAQKEGYRQIAAFFEETAGNEKEHAKLWFKLLHGGEVPTTAENLKAAAEGENGEWTEMYKRMASEAKAEGFADIAYLFEAVGNIEKEHEERYLALLKNVNDGSVFAKKEKAVWICRNCGHTTDAKNAPGQCPVCAHPQAFFELRAVNY